MKYPSRSDYYSAIRNPGFAFRKKDPNTQVERVLDPQLVSGRVVERVRPNGMREAWSASGGFAIAFKYETPKPQKLWAVRCFYRSGFEATRHYKKVAVNLEKHADGHDYFVGCEFLEEGIRVLGACYPIVKMEWVEGESLKKFIKRNLDRRGVLEKLASKWEELAQNLFQGGIAHGDLQHGNVLVVDGFGGLDLKLIDYDSLYFSREGNGIDDCVKGLGDYQHPLRESLKKRCLAIDFFPQLVVYASVLALAAKPQLWDKFNLDAREGLLFAKEDFQSPQRASVFEALSRLPEPLPALARSLQNICHCQTFEQIPTLETVLETIQTTGAAYKVRGRARPRPIPQRQQQPAESFLSRLLGWGDRRPPAPPEPEAAPQLHAPVGDSEPDSPPVDVEIVLDRQPVPAVAPEEPPPASTAPAPAASPAPVDRAPDPKNPKKLLWDPRQHKPATPPPAAKPRARSPQPTRPGAIVRSDALPTPEQPPVPASRGKSLQDWIAFSSQAVTETYSTLTQSVARMLAPRTWPTAEVATIVDRPPAWCHRQRYKYPDKFSAGKHYLKDEEGVVHWTWSGIAQLRSLLAAEHTIPDATLPTKAVGDRLGVPPEQLTKLKTKYPEEFSEGTHYFTDRQKRYHWSAEGIEKLQSLLATQPPTEAKPKKKKRKTKPRSRKIG